MPQPHLPNRTRPLGSTNRSPEHYPFGMLMQGRGFEVGKGYRYGFGGKEAIRQVDDRQLTYDYTARIYQTGICRMFSLDPKGKWYPDLTPYSFVGNMPIIAVDPTGEFIIVSGKLESGAIVEYKYSYESNRTWAENTPAFIISTAEALDRLLEKKALEITLEPVDASDKATTVGMLFNLMDDIDNGLRILESQDGANRFSTKGLDQVDKEIGVKGLVYFNCNDGILFRLNNEAKLYDRHLYDPILPVDLGRNSPTSLLGHELIHAWNCFFDKNYQKRKEDKSTQSEKLLKPFPNLEEKIVTINYANQMNTKLEESKRIDYGLDRYRTDGVTSTTPEIKP